MIHIRDFNRSGRTTHLLERAIEEALAGRLVYIIGSDINHVANLMYQLSSLPQYDVLSEQLKNKIKIAPYPSIEHHLDIRHMRIIGLAPEHHIVLMDHWAIESRFGKLLEMWISQIDTNWEIRKDG
jgi:hypothetical protein